MEMAAAIQKAIVTLPNYGVFDQISFGIGQDTAILRGFASRPTLKESAEKVVRQVKGVEEVINQIEVMALSGSDDELRADLYGNIYGDTALALYISLVEARIEVEATDTRQRRGSPLWWPTLVNRRSTNWGFPNVPRHGQT